MSSSANVTVSPHAVSISGVCILLPLFCLFFMATIFGNGQMENIPYRHCRPKIIRQPHVP